uniref:Putative secreted protein n=1 Tax=Anopheles marajoara TaxID=58244 RepID=A0A2M4C6G6_9DIPT
MRDSKLPKLTFHPLVAPSLSLCFFSIPLRASVSAADLPEESSRDPFLNSLFVTLFFIEFFLPSTHDPMARGPCQLPDSPSNPSDHSAFSFHSKEATGTGTFHFPSRYQEKDLPRMPHQHPSRWWYLSRGPADRPDTVTARTRDL